MGDGQYLDLLLLAMVAGFVLLRLRSVLGRRTGNERRPADSVSEVDEKSKDDNVIELPDRQDKDGDGEQTTADASLWAEDSPVGAGLTEIKIADHGFEPEQFLSGSRAAYEAIVQAFARGDRETLGTLLSEEVYENFESALSEREDQHNSLESSIVSLDNADIVEARMNGRMAEVTVKIVAETISVLKDRDGELIDPAAAHPRHVTDIWTFARDTRSRDPNWRLIETRSEN